MKVGNAENAFHGLIERFAGAMGICKVLAKIAKKKNNFQKANVKIGFLQALHIQCGAGNQHTHWHLQTTSQEKALKMFLLLAMIDKLWDCLMRGQNATLTLAQLFCVSAQQKISGLWGLTHKPYAKSIFI